MSLKNNPILERIERTLAEKREQGLYRILAKPAEVRIDLSTNSYLCLHENREVIDMVLLESCRRPFGNCASRLVSCQSDYYERLETGIAAWKHAESALVFNSGYAANIGVLQALASRQTEVFCDKLNHASIIDGIRLSNARMTRYTHCDISDLSEKMRLSTAAEKIIVTDTVFSMDGDCAPLADICELALKYNALVMIDEAHACGIFGANGEGYAAAVGVERAIDVCIGTLSKAIAGVGGFYAGSALVKEYLVNHARSLIFSTGLPHDALVWNEIAVRYVRQHPQMGPAVLKSAARFQAALNEAGFVTGPSASQIVPCIIGSSPKAVALSQFLMAHGVKAPAVRPPTVPLGTERIRFSVHTNFSDSRQDEVIGLLKEWQKLHG